jgi:N-acetyl-anhydromuramyl-L-alanine amidase AmpD
MPAAQGQDPTYPATVARAVTALVVHCSATPSGQALRGCAPIVIDAWHRARGFRRGVNARRAFNDDLLSIGYHFVVDLDGKVWSGRHVDEVGAHAVNHNAQSVGICLVGGAELDARYTQDQWDSLALLVRRLLPMVRPGAGVVGHRDLSPDANGNGVVDPGEWLKTCPGFNVSHWLARGMKPLPHHVLPQAQEAA